MEESGNLFGTFAHNLDPKGRLMLPKKLGLVPGTTLYLMRGYDGCFEIHQEESFQKQMKLAKELTFTKKNARLHARLTIGSSTEVKVDNQGRIQIPTLWVNKYNLKKEVYLVGMLDHFELWDKETWDHYEATNEELFEENAQSLGEEE